MKRTGRLLAMALFASTAVVIQAPGAGVQAADIATFHGLSPARLLDTRAGAGTIDNRFQGSGPVLAGSTVNSKSAVAAGCRLPVRVLLRSTSPSPNPPAPVF